MIDYKEYVKAETFDFPKIDTCEMTVVHNSFFEERKFVHDTMMCVYHEKIYMAWYSCPRGEIADDTMIIGKTSSDNGKSWSEPFIIASDDGSRGAVRHYVPVCFAIDKGRLYAIISEMTRHDRPVSTGLYRMDNKKGTESWEYVTDIISEKDNVSLIVNNNVLSLPNGGYIMSGRYYPEKNCYPDRPCVLVCADGDITKWKIVPLCGEALGTCPETSVTLTADGKLIAVTRNAAGKKSIFFISEDMGSMWTRVENSLPVVDTKLYAYTLSNGKTLVIFNCSSNGKERTRLCLGVLNTQTMLFENVRTLAFGMSEVGDIYHYPCVVENRGTVFVSCTVNKGNVRSAAVFRIDISAI